MYQKNQYFEGVCEDYTHDGMGIVKADGFTYFVKGMLVGEAGQLKVIKVLKHYGVARLISLNIISPERVDPPCPVYKACGGCHLQHLSKKGQQAFKTKRIKDVLERIGHVKCEVLPTVMMEHPWHYRNKVQLPCGMKDGHLITGFYKQRSNEIVASDYCWIQNEDGNELALKTREVLDEYKIRAYDKITHQGCLRHILVKTAVATGELMLVLITNGEPFKHKEEIVSRLTKQFPHLKTIVQNINERHDNVILGDKEIVWYGNGYIEDEMGHVRFRISSRSFYQVNPEMAWKMYQKVVELACLNGTQVVIDAYCGIGTISLFLAKYAKKVYGVEIVDQAIHDAKENAKLNGIENVEFYVDDAGAFMKEKAKSSELIDVVVVDPPRKGLSQIFLDSLIVLHPKRVVYVACDISTMARDMAYLQDHGYTCDFAQGFDQFYGTYHIECVASLTYREEDVDA